MERVAIYLRKSRQDMESERDGEQDTLSKHRNALLKYAKDKSLNVIRIYEEVVSGEKIANRPQMQSLLNDVENGLYEAVLVMDMDRLGRGNMQEQGLIIDTFRESGTLIVTPRKTYDLRNEMDEEWSEFEAFIARKELKIITRRLQSGRLRSAQEGNFNGTYAPFGYSIRKTSKERTLAINEQEAVIVRMIFGLYVNDDIGMNKLADYLNERSIPFKDGKLFSNWNVNQILKNDVYIGIVSWYKKQVKNKKRVQFKGKHEPIIDVELFKRAQQKLANREASSLKQKSTLRNPLSGILRCGLCGKAMSRNCTLRDKEFIRCMTYGCKNYGTGMKRVEEALLERMEKLMESHKLKVKERKTEQSLDLEKKLLDAALKEWNELKRQKNNLHDLLEREVYTVDVYLERSARLAEQIKEKEEAIRILRIDFEQKEREQKTRREFIPALVNVMKLYHKTNSIEMKNKLLKAVLHKAVYTKIDPTPNGFFELALHPKLPSVEGI